jgi:hypothetical protein
MSALQSLGFTVGTAFASGLNLYATVAVLGLLERYRVVRLPDSLNVIAHPAVIITAIVLYAVEFVADKVPYVDTVWDAVHTFIRPPAAALLAYAALGDVPDVWRVLGGLLAGSVALTSHGTKASARAAINASPEPFSNWIASLGEDGMAIFLVWMAAMHPVLTVFIVAALLVLCAWLLLRLAKFIGQVLGRLFPRPRPNEE